MKRWLILRAITLGTCFGPVTGPIPPGIVEVTPPAEYAAIWANVERCSGLTRPMGEIRWYKVPGALDFAYEGRIVMGLYQYPGRITLAESVMVFDDHIAHEILHALLRGPARGDAHPVEYFQVKCRGVVVP